MPSIGPISRITAWVVLLAAASFAQTAAPAFSRPEPGELIRRVVDNEVKASKDDSARFKFRGTKTTPRGSTTKIYIETKVATAGIVVAYNGNPLTPEQRRAEEARIERFIKNPDELEKKRRQKQQDADRTLRIVRAIPDAFLFEYAGEQPGSLGVGKPGDPLLVLKFRPDPRYEPPSRIEQVLTGMQGIVLVDAARNRLATIDGTLFKDVGFGWGILGHLDKGGRFLVQQQDIGDNYWAISRMNLDFTGKILLVKSLAISTTDVFSDFKPVPLDLTFGQAVEMLKKEEPVVAEKATAGDVGKTTSH
ncbi:MAG: hypothetical protein HYR57_03470 [Candidatus Koribacter versatilis]|nr:hypothetical protein [Candidatus Koribacter versatilis]